MQNFTCSLRGAGVGADTGNLPKISLAATTIEHFRSKLNGSHCSKENHKDRHGRAVSFSILPATLQDLSAHISYFNCEYLCLIVSQLSILEEREGEENTEQKGAGGRSPEERLSRRSRETKWELLLHQSQGSGFPIILQLEPAGESTHRGSLPVMASLESMAVLSPHHVPCAPTPLPCSPALLSIQPHCCPHGWTQTWPQPPCPRDVSPAHLPPRQLQGGTVA